jgi:Ca-activated chloride channel family protein
MINSLILLALFSLLFLAYNFAKRQKKVTLPYSKVMVAPSNKGIKIWCIKYGSLFFWVALAFIAVALISPSYKAKRADGGSSDHKIELPREGIALYFLLDQSGSMAETVQVDSRQISKMTLAKEAIRQFVVGDTNLNLSGRKNDLVGLIAFARAARILCPLTLDRTAILQSLEEIFPVTKEFQNGTSIGYAIFKAVNIIVSTKYFAERQMAQKKPAYAIKNQALVVITDGLQSPHPQDRDNPFRYIPVEEAIRYAVENGVRVYFIGVDPIFKRAEFKTEVEKLKALVKDSGGSFYISSYGLPIGQILAEIDTLEKSSYTPKLALETKEPAQYISLIPFCILAALFCLAVGIVLETTYAKTVP